MKLDRIEEVLENHPDRTFAFDEIGPLMIRPVGGAFWAPTYSSWANPIEAHFGPLREFVLNNLNHPIRVVLTRRLHDHLKWRNANTGDP